MSEIEMKKGFKIVFDVERLRERIEGEGLDEVLKEAREQIESEIRVIADIWQKKQKTQSEDH